jgi:hypothetical protein
MVKAEAQVADPQPTHELIIKVQGKIQAFDLKMRRTFLHKGSYPCIKTQNPIIKDRDKVYHLLDFEEPTYVRDALLEDGDNYLYAKVHPWDGYEDSEDDEDEES